MTGALAAHYAHALAEAVFAKDAGLTPERAVEQMRSVDQLISGSPQLKVALLSPAINKQRKSAVLSRLRGTRAAPAGSEFSIGDCFPPPNKRSARYPVGVRGGRG